MKEKADCWIVITGQPVFTCKTRKQAREYVKKNKTNVRPKYSYIGKCIENHKQIILDV